MLENKEDQFQFEITIDIRDRNGNPTGERKIYGANSGKDLERFFIRNTPRPKRKGKKKKAKNLPNKEQADKIMKEIQNDN